MFLAPALPFAPVLTGKAFEVSGAASEVPKLSYVEVRQAGCSGNLGCFGSAAFQSGFLVTPGLCAMGGSDGVPVTPGLSLMGETN